VPQTDLVVTKTASNMTPNSGATITFTITAANLGPSPATAVSVSDLLPSGYTFVSSSTATGTYTPGTGVWAVGALASGAAAVSLTITATVNSSGVYANTATISGGQADPISANNSVTVTPVPITDTNLAITKTASSLSPGVGTTITFTLTASNLGSSPSTTVVVNDLLASGYTFVSAAASTGSYVSGTGVWTIGALANGASATLTITATVNLSGVYANTATISGELTDPVPANNTATVTPVPVPQTNLSVFKSVNNLTPYVGDTIVFTVVASNGGPSPATAVVVNDPLTVAYTFVSATTTAGTYNSGTGVWTIGSMANGETQTLTITAIVNAAGQ
jgi:uncharacterized repeat protein (TIGR01451 family)